MSKRTPVATQEHDTSANAPAIPEPGQGKRGEEGYLGYLLRQASAAQRLRMERAMADVGVTLPQFLVLTMLRAYPGISNADLARLTMLTPQTVSVIVTNLERSGAITRRPHAVHGRIQHIDTGGVCPACSMPKTLGRHRAGSARGVHARRGRGRAALARTRRQAR